jgi:hypothetical protein
MQTTHPSSGLVLSGCIAVAVLALWSTIEFYSRTEGLAGANADVYKIGEQAARFQSLASALPAAGVIGYVSDLPTAQTVGSAMYGGAQYALAPRLVTDHLLESHADWVIGNFSKPLDVIQFGKDHGLTLVRDFGSGVALYRSRVP